MATVNRLEEITKFIIEALRYAKIKKKRPTYDFIDQTILLKDGDINEDDFGKCIDKLLSMGILTNKKTQRNNWIVSR